MNNTLSYKGYVGTVECSIEDNCLFGRVLGIKAIIGYEGKTLEELVNDFHDMIDFYLECCERDGKEPEVPYKGSFNVRVSPELHKKAAIYAINNNTSLNKVVEDALQKALA